MQNRFALFVTLVFCSIVGSAQDWSNTPIPANPGAGKVWQLQQNFSDDFNYNGKNSTFTSKWNDTYFNGWTGPGLTHWTTGSSSVSNGKLVIGASRRSGTNKVNCGVVTSKTKVIYPIYMEARIKVSNLELSSNFWMLSGNDEREIDVLEVYGGASQDWFARNMSTNFHVFVRNSNNNNIINDFNDQTHNSLPGNAFWRSAYHNFGVYWKSPSEVFFYIDGVETPDGSWAQAVMIDKDYTGATMNKNQYKMDQSVYMIIDTEDHEWRSNQGIVASDADLANNNKNKMYVDWVRTYKPVNASSGQVIANGTYNIKSPYLNENLGAFSWNGHDARTINAGSFADQKWDLIHLGGNVYHIKNVGTGRYLEVPFALCGNGNDVKTWTSGGGNHQKWFIVKTGNQYVLRPNHCRWQAADRPSLELTPRPKGFVGDFAVALARNPSPAEELALNISLPSDQQVNITIFDAGGRLIGTRQIEGIRGNSRLSLSDSFGQAATGVYLIQTEASGEVITRRVVVQ